MKIKKQEQELTKMRSKLDKVMTKLYLPSQDEVIEGLNNDLN
jgi:hypothetical protein